MKATKIKLHPFFCHIKNMTKTIWDTPEHINKEDLPWINEVILSLKAKNGTKFKDILGVKLSKENEYGETRREQIFFNRVIGWPEGRSYCYYNQDPQNHHFLGICEKDIGNIIIGVGKVEELTMQ